MAKNATQSPLPTLRGWRARNLLNVKQGRDPWWGSDGADEAGHAIFFNIEAGLRAGIQVLNSYEELHFGGRMSILQIATRWAPADDPHASNDPQAYAKAIESLTGFKPEDELNLFIPGGQRIGNWPALRRLLEGMVQVEQFRGLVLPDATWQTAMNLWEWLRNR